MSETIRPCSWCGKEPEKSDDVSDYRSCDTDGCPESLVEDPTVLELWNDRQAAILARRKADVLGGITIALHKRLSAEQWTSPFGHDINTVKIDGQETIEEMIDSYIKAGK